METLLLQSNSKKDTALLQHLAEKIGLKTHKVTVDEMEDIALAYAMKKGRTGKYVDTNAYLEKLKGK